MVQQTTLECCQDTELRRRVARMQHALAAQGQCFLLEPTPALLALFSTAATLTVDPRVNGGVAVLGRGSVCVPDTHVSRNLAQLRIVACPHGAGVLELTSTRPGMRVCRCPAHGGGAVHAWQDIRGAPPMVLLHPGDCISLLPQGDYTFLVRTASPADVLTSPHLSASSSAPSSSATAPAAPAIASVLKPVLRGRIMQAPAAISSNPRT